MAQKTLLQIAQTISSELNFPSPTTVVSSSDQNVLQILNLTRAVCDDLLSEFDWQTQLVRYQFSTVSGQDTYSMPTDLDRFVSGTFFDQNNRWPLIGPETPTSWEWLKSADYTATPFNQFRIQNNQLIINPVPGDTVFTFNFEYISKYYVQDGSTGLRKPDFTQDSDICVFDHRVVVYAVKLKLKEAKGLDTTAAFTDYERALTFAQGKDTPGPKLRLTGRPSIRLLSNDNTPDGSWSM